MYHEKDRERTTADRLLILLGIWKSKDRCVLHVAPGMRLERSESRDSIEGQCRCEPSSEQESCSWLPRDKDSHRVVLLGQKSRAGEPDISCVWYGLGREGASGQEVTAESELAGRWGIAAAPLGGMWGSAGVINSALRRNALSDFHFDCFKGQWKQQEDISCWFLQELGSFSGH